MSFQIRSWLHTRPHPFPFPANTHLKAQGAGGAGVWFAKLPIEWIQFFCHVSAYSMWCANPTNFREDDARLNLVRKLETERKRCDTRSPDWWRFKNQMPLKMYIYAAGWKPFPALLSCIDCQWKKLNLERFWNANPNDPLVVSGHSS